MNLFYKIKLQSFFILGRSEDELSSYDYEIRNLKEFVITYVLKKKIRYEEINHNLEFEINQPSEKYCSKHQRYMNIPIVMNGLLDRHVNCISKKRYITFSLEFLTVEMLNLQCV